MLGNFVIETKRPAVTGRRADGNSYGCEFVDPLHPSVAKHLQVKLRQS